MVLLVVMRLDDAYGISIASAIEEATRRQLALASVYAALSRLEAKGLVTSSLGESTPERGGRCKRYFRATPKGVLTTQSSQRALTQLWSDLPELKLGIAV